MNEWNREHWVPGGGDAFVFFAVFGRMPESFQIDASKYRTTGLPKGVDIRAFTRQANTEYIAGFTDGYAWDQFAARHVKQAAAVNAAPDCLVIAGTVEDPSDLGYLRDVVGMTTFLLDQGGLAIHDLQTVTWFDPREWHEQIFEPAAPVPRQHVITLLSPEEDSPEFTWFHTRGLRKFGRPDVSVHDVPRHLTDAVTNLCGRLIEFQAFGGVVAEGQEIRMETLPPGATAHHAGDIEDLNFNNVHIEIVWPVA